MEVIKKYKIIVIPTFLFFKTTEIHRITGANRNILIKLIKKYTNRILIQHSHQQKSISLTNFQIDGSNDILAEIKKIREKKEDLYFESQVEALCGLHALNNALQYPLFDKNYLVASAKLLQIKESRLYHDETENQNNAYFDEFGNLNVDVLEVALRKKNVTLNRFSLNDEIIPVGMYILCTGNHWFAFRKFLENGPIWNLDSLLPEPRVIKDLTKLKDHRMSIFLISDIIENSLF